MSSHIALRQRGMSVRGSWSVFWQCGLSTGNLSHHFSQRRSTANAPREALGDWPAEMNELLNFCITRSSKSRKPVFAFRRFSARRTAWLGVEASLLLRLAQPAQRSDARESVRYGTAHRIATGGRTGGRIFTFDIHGFASIDPPANIKSKDLTTLSRFDPAVFSGRRSKAAKCVQLFSNIHSHGLSPGSVGNPEQFVQTESIEKCAHADYAVRAVKVSNIEIRDLTHAGARSWCGGIIGKSDPTLDCLSRVARLGVETQLGLRRMLMHHVDQLFKQDEIFRYRSHSRANNNTIELFPPESIENECLRGFSKIRQAKLHLVTQAP